MISDDNVALWLQRYVDAWRRADDDLVRGLFTPDAIYHTDPFRDPFIGHDAILRYWHESGDAPDAFDAHYEPVHVAADFAVAQGVSRYFSDDRSHVERDYSNVFLLWFATAGLCREYHEWYMQRRETGQGVDASQ